MIIGSKMGQSGQKYANQIICVFWFVYSRAGCQFTFLKLQSGPTQIVKQNGCTKLDLSKKNHYLCRLFQVKPKMWGKWLKNAYFILFFFRIFFCILLLKAPLLNKKIHKKCFYNFFINVIICLILKPENVQIGTFRGQFQSLFKYLEKKEIVYNTST